MFRKKSSLVVFLVIVCVIIGGIFIPPTAEFSDINTIYEIENNEEFIIKERIFTIGKHYDVFVVKDNKEIKIGEIRGKVIRLFGDVFTFYDMNDNVIAYEEEVFKLFKITRTAKVYTADGVLMGYIGEDTITKFFDPGYYFNYYDANQNEIGHSDQNVLSLFKKNGIYNMNGRKEYSINQKFNLIRDVYKITSVENPSIPKVYVLFSACIEDAIRDSEIAERNSSDE